MPALRSAEVSVVAVVGALDHDVKQARIDVTVTFDGAKVLGKALVALAIGLRHGREAFLAL